MWQWIGLTLFGCLTLYLWREVAQLYDAYKAIDEGSNAAWRTRMERTCMVMGLWQWAVAILILLIPGTSPGVLWVNATALFLMGGLLMLTRKSRLPL